MDGTTSLGQSNPTVKHGLSRRDSARAGTRRGLKEGQLAKGAGPHQARLLQLRAGLGGDMDVTQDYDLKRKLL